MQALPVKTGPGRPKDQEKRAAILDAAKRLFPTRGFDATSMEAIAAEAGVSKLTVYSHFKDKEALFFQTVCEKCEEQLPHAVFEIEPGAPLREQLTRIGHAFFQLITSPEAMALHRLMTAQPSEKLASLFWEAGPQRCRAELSSFFRAEIAAGALEMPDPERAASHFICLMKGEPHAKLSYGCCSCVSPKDVAAHIDAVVDLFVRAYSPRPGNEDSAYNRGRSGGAPRG